MANVQRLWNYNYALRRRRIAKYLEAALEQFESI